MDPKPGGHDRQLRGIKESRSICLAITPPMYQALNGLREEEWAIMTKAGWGTTTEEGRLLNTRINDFFASISGNSGGEVTIDASTQEALYLLLIGALGARTVREADPRYYRREFLPSIIESNDSLRSLFGSIVDATGKSPTLNEDPFVWVALGMPQRLSGGQLREFAQTSEIARYLQNRRRSLPQ